MFLLEDLRREWCSGTQCHAEPMGPHDELTRRIFDHLVPDEHSWEYVEWEDSFLAVLVLAPDWRLARSPVSTFEISRG